MTIIIIFYVTKEKIFQKKFCELEKKHYLCTRIQEEGFGRPIGKCPLAG